MTIKANVENIVGDLEGFFTDIKTNVVAPVKAAVAAGGKNISADLSVVAAAAEAVSAAVSKIPGNVGVQVGTYTSIAVGLIDFFEGVFSGSSSSAAAVAAPASTVVTPSVAQTSTDGLGDADADTGAL